MPCVFILLRAKDGRKRPTRKVVPVRKGELVEELEKVFPADPFSGEHNFCVHDEQSITLYCAATDVGVLVGPEHHYLMAVSHELRIREFYNTNKKDYVLGLITGDEILFATSPDSEAVRGRIQYLGPAGVLGKKGVYFGVEIDKDDKYRGKGTTDGLPYFNCGRKNAVWVSMDMVIYNPGSTPHGSKPSSATIKKASNMAQPQHSKLYKEGDRVVSYSMKDQRPIFATVRWTRTAQLSKSGPPLIFAGLETDSVIDCAEEFPEIHLNATNMAEFKVERGHTKLIIPEMLLLTETEFTKQQKQVEKSATAAFDQTKDNQQTRLNEDNAHRRVKEEIQDNEDQIPSWVRMENLVLLKNADHLRSGVIKFIGFLPGYRQIFVGLEMDDFMPGCGDGDFQGNRYFSCPAGRGYFCCISDIQSLESVYNPSVVSLPVHTSSVPTNNQVSKTVSAATVASPTVSTESQIQKLMREKEALIQSQQDEIKRLTEEFQRDKREMEAALSEQKRMTSQTQDQLDLISTQRQGMLTQLQQRARESQHLQEQNTYLQQYNARLRDERDEKKSEIDRHQREVAQYNHQLAQLRNDKDTEIAHLQSQIVQLQSRVEQQPKLGDDKDISFWLVSHSEVHFTGQELGRGGYGSVTIGNFRGQSVAVKELHSSIKSPYYDKLLRREISLMAKIRHPNLLLFVAAVLDKPGRNDPIIITELLDTDLRSAYQDGKLANNRVRLFILRDVAAALNYLHLHIEPIVHRDVSSANVLLQALPDNKWRGKLSDFGSANIVQYASTAGPGNRVYTAPEVLRGEKQSTKMDVYSYGMLFCEIFTNQFPDPEAFPSMLNSMARSWPLMHRIVSSCIEHDPIKRPAMNSIVDQLNTFTK